MNWSESRRSAAAGGALVVIVVAAYCNSLLGALVFDDGPAIRENPTIRTLWPITTPLSPPANSGVGGRPLANLSFALNYATAGLDVRGYHAGNLLLHLGSALLLFGIVRRTRRSRPGVCHNDSVAWGTAVAGLWGVHPLTTASVAYISQRTELLMGFFYLLTLYAFVRACGAAIAGVPSAIDSGRAGRPRSREKIWLAVSLAACALGMMSKEVMLTAPVVVLLYDRTFIAGTFPAAWRARGRYYAALAGTGLVLGWMLTTGLAQRSVGFGLGVSAFDYALTEGRAILHYLRLAVVPHPLIFDYGAIYSSSVAATLVAIGMAGTAAWAVLRGSRIGFLAACFFILLAPTSSVVPVAEQPIAENRMYLPLAALVVMGVGATGGVRGWRGAVLLGVAVALGTLTMVRNRDYRSAIALWADTVAKRPENPRAHFNHGVALLDLKRPADAVAAFERAIRLKPLDTKAHNSLGNALLELGRVAEAVKSYAEAVRLEPAYARAWYNYGTALQRQGGTEAAIACFERALRLDPNMADAHNALGNAYFQREQPAQAVTHYEAAVRIDPTLVEAQYNGGSASLELGRVADAVVYLTAAARLKPDDAEIRNNLGAALVRSGRVAEGSAEFEHALRLKPDYAEARSNLEMIRARRR